MEIKATLQYSNPQIISEISLPKDFTLNQLYQTICICAEWDTDRKCTFLRNGSVIEGSASLTEELFAGESTLHCVIGTIDQPDWCWRIEKVLLPDQSKQNNQSELSELTKSTQSAKTTKTVKTTESTKSAEQPTWPVLIRQRGGTILTKAKNVFELNRYKNGWYGNLNDVVLANVNLKLEVVFHDQGVSQTDGFDYAKCKSCVTELMQFKVDHMKEIEQMLDIVPPKGILKKERAEFIAEAYRTKPDCTRKILEQMSLVEYEAFWDLYEAEDTRYAFSEKECFQYTMLLTYGLISIDTDKSVQMSVELIKGIQLFFSQSVGAELLRFHMAKAVVCAGVLLYGFMNKPLYDWVMDACYSDFLTVQQKELYWKNLIQIGKFEREKIEWIKAGKFFMNEKTDIASAFACSMKDVEQLPFYIPNSRLVEDIEWYGMTLTDQELNLLGAVLKKRCRCPENMLWRLSYAMIQNCMNGKRVDYVAQFSYVYGVKGSRDDAIRLIKAAIENVLAKVRLPKYFGHTEEEYFALTGGK